MVALAKNLISEIVALFPFNDYKFMTIITQGELLEHQETWSFLRLSVLQLQKKKYHFNEFHLICTCNSEIHTYLYYQSNPPLCNNFYFLQLARMLSQINCNKTIVNYLGKRSYISFVLLYITIVYSTIKYTTFWVDLRKLVVYRSGDTSLLLH